MTCVQTPASLLRLLKGHIFKNNNKYSASHNYNDILAEILLLYLQRFRQDQGKCGVTLETVTSSEQGKVFTCCQRKDS